LKRQHHVVTHAQLLEFGLTRHAIAHRVRIGKLRRLWRGIYAVGEREPSREGWWMAAVLAAGPGAALSHESAAQLWGIRRWTRGPIHVSVPLTAFRTRAGIHIHRRAALAPVRHKGIPVAGVVDAIVDIAPAVSVDELETVIGEADIRRLTDPEKLRRALDGIPSRPGVAKVRRTLDRRTYVMTHTHLERRFLPLVRRAGLPPPQSQRHIGRARVDFVWPELELVIETDGLTYHRTAAQQAEDLRRDHTHAAEGRTPLRFSHGQIRYEAGHVLEVLTAVRQRLCRAPR
jgi:very-short-patch-repair endonuclease